MSSSVLLFFSTGYPYGSGESFIENEIGYLKCFSKIIIIPVNATLTDKIHAREINLQNSYVMDIDAERLGAIKLLKFACLALIQPTFWKESIVAINKRGIKGMVELFRFTVIGEHRAYQVRNIISELQLNSHDCVVYSYWMHMPLYVAIRSVKNAKKILTRCHGFDLYEYRSDGYIPYRSLFLKKATHIVPISNQGLEYLKSKYPDYEEKYHCSRLGTIDNGITDIDNDSILHIITCSRLVGLKRIELIIKALSKYRYGLVEWTHIGDGPLHDDILEQAEYYLRDSNIRFKLTGEMPNKDILGYYKNHSFDCFINVSSTEGLPVSIMEAMSFGMPIIATNVGGVSEIVINNYNGFLLEKDFCLEGLVGLLEWFGKNKSSRTVELMRKNSRCLWEKKCDANVNYRSFIELLN